MDTIRATMSSMDRHLKILIELFSEQMDKMLTIVGDVRQSLITSESASAATTTTTTTTQSPLTNSTPVKTSSSKLDALYAKMAPLLEVSQKMDQVQFQSLPHPSPPPPLLHPLQRLILMNDDNE